MQEVYCLRYFITQWEDEMKDPQRENFRNRMDESPNFTTRHKQLAN